MIFNINKDDDIKLNKLFNTLEENILVSDFYIEYLSSFAHKAGQDILTLDSLINKLEVNNYKELLVKHKANQIKKLIASDYNRDPYYLSININKDVKKSKWKITKDKYFKNEPFIYKDTVENENDYFIEYNHLGYFNDEFKYICATQNNTIWMSITPNEIETMKETIRNANGDVLTFGLGLGYYPFMCSLKNNVNSITIIEMDKNAIELFETYILPQFKYKNKIKIINDNALVYPTITQKKYNYSFADIWHTVDDGLELYIRLKLTEKYNYSSSYSYWIEDSLLIMFRRIVINLINEEYNGSTDEDYKDNSSFINVIMNSLHFNLKNIQFHSYEDIKSMLKKESLIKLITDLNI